MADVIERPLKLTTGRERAGVGAAILAGIGAGVFGGYADVMTLVAEVIPDRGLILHAEPCILIAINVL
ncbi:MAG: hypothetical protein KF726_20025 [Anaerolineae bacterium]|nr:hypothetical protein [Anaerolineae bacterium]